MNEEQLIEFVNWLPTAVPEFQDAAPEQIVQALNQMYESEEGQQMLSQLFTAFQESKADAQSQMFKKGGKLGQLVEKAKKGKKMCCKKKEVLQGGMVNKVAEKMQRGAKIDPDNNAPIVNTRNYDKAQSRLKKPIYDVPSDFVYFFDDSDREQGFYWPLTHKNGREEWVLAADGKDGLKGGTRTIINPGTPQADTTYAFTLYANDPKLRRNIGFSVKDKDHMLGYQDEVNTIDSLIDAATQMRPDRRDMVKKDKDGGELATNTSANTLSNVGLIPKAQDGLSVQPEVRPSGLKGLFWKPTYQPRVDASGYEGDTPWTGERATYYKPNGDLLQILTKNYAPGNNAITTRTIKQPFTPLADTTTVVSNQYGTRKVPTSQFNEVFKRNFDKKNK